MSYQESRLPWVYGGEYDRFSVFIKKIVQAWLGLDIHLSFVFDGEPLTDVLPDSRLTSLHIGPEEPIKFATCISRLSSKQVHHSELFFRTSRATRATPRFLGETQIIPPLVYPSCIETLLELSSEFRGLDVYFADREADPFIVELAGRLGAYVAGNDSDFVVLNTPGYLGYIPLEEFEWKLGAVPEPTRTRTLSITSSIASLSISDFGSDSSILEDLAEFDDRGFVPVRKKKSRVANAKAKLHPPTAPGQAPTQKSLIPPEEHSSLILRVYTPDVVALSLGIPVALLPLLGAIVGNDFTHNIKLNTGKPPGALALPGYTHQKLLFEYKLNAAQRIVYAANTLSSVLRAMDKKRKSGSRPKQRSVLDLIRTTVTQMLLRPDHITEREINGIVNGIVDSALQYAIPPSPPMPRGKPRLWPTPFCALHQDIGQCRLEPFVPEPPQEHELISSGKKQDVFSMVQNQYLRLYREGALDPQVLDIVITGTMWPRLFLENPDYTSASGQSDAGGALRQWVYAIVNQGIGVYVPPTEEGEEEEDPVSSAGTQGLVNVSRPENGPEGSEDEDEVIDVVEEEDLEEAEDPLVALKGALQRLRGVGPAGMNAGLPTVPDHGHESEEEGEDEEEGGKSEECHVMEYVRRGHRVAGCPLLVQDLTTLLERAIERDDGPVASPDFGRPAMQNLAVPRTSRNYPIQLAEERERLCVLLIACGSDTQQVRDLEKDWVGPVIITRWLVRWAGVVEKEKGGGRFVANPFFKTWTRGEIAALLRAFSPIEQREEGDEEEGGGANTTGSENASEWDISERAVQLMARALSVIEAVRMLIHVLCLTHRVPLRLARFKGRAFHEGCRDGDIGPQPAIDASILSAVEEGLEECIREDAVKRPKKKKDVKPAMTSVKIAQRGVSFNVLARLDAST